MAKKGPIPDVPVLRHLSLNVEANDFLTILGPSGSGKSTLLRTIAGLIIPITGRVVLNDTDITLQPPHQREVSLVFQNGGWYDHLTVHQHFQFDGLSQEEIHQYLQQLGLTEFASLRPSQLSGGQAQRLAIGRALARKRSILLLDEPLSQLDQSVRESLRRLLQSIHSQGHTLVYVTHDQTDAMLLASKIAVLHQGGIQQIGSPQSLFDDPNHRCVAEMLGQPPMQFFDVHVSIDRRFQRDAEAIKHAMLQGVTSKSSEVRRHAGIRPGAWRIAERKTLEEIRQSLVNHVSFDATFVEQHFLGHQRLLQFAIHRSAMPNVYVLDSRTNDSQQYISGNDYTISVSLSDIHWFDAVTGDRISTVST